MKFLPLVLALALLGFQQHSAPPASLASAEKRASEERERHNQAAIAINDLAGNIHSETDALALVDKIADVFASSLPPAWLTRDIRQRIALAEYQAVSDPSRLIPEQRVADVWNSYVREISASDEALVTAAEIHNMRDAFLAASQLSWSRSTIHAVWTVPNIYAVGPDGKVADGCRPVETLRLFYDLDMIFDNLRSARQRLQKGFVLSDELNKLQENPPTNQRTTARLEARVDTNPMRPAEARYVQQHGPYILSAVVLKLFDELFPPTATSSMGQSQNCPGALTYQNRDQG
jgi:hypothetical protein